MTATTATMDITNPVLRGMYPDPSWSAGSEWPW